MEDGDKRQNYVDNLAKQLEKAVLASEFNNTPVGKYLIDILQTDASLFAQQIASDKFINDHNGYLDARAKLSYVASLLSRLQKTADPNLEANLRQKIDEAQSDGE
jgi:hypothetical protein